ncbi:hypothetical protein M2D07_027180 [Pseudomonas sp. BGr12]|uniref:hypothetical protein n=1 Tax=Pseudomonas sp. BGr12 TaxID=2936269 RepID=UPI00255A0DEF|nr:hypothetical protein [Pseudomonas sp. BJa5]MDL2430727.1 hypothetical protein [Pseudomonas sp. BJa5]
MGSKLGKAKSLWTRPFLFMLSGYIYFSVIGYGVIYPIHALLGKKTSETLIASAKHQGAGRPLCSWFLSLKISDKNTDSYCVSKRIYNAYAKSRDVFSPREIAYAGVVIKRSFLGTSLVSVDYLEWKSLEGKTVRAEL